MSLTIDYYCDRCSEVSSNKVMTSMLCVCGGVMRLLDGAMVNVFKPYYNESHNEQINNAREEKRMLKKHGTILMGDLPSRMKKSAYLKKNREDYVADIYKREYNLKYPKGKKVKFDEKNIRFVPTT